MEYKNNLIKLNDLRNKLESFLCMILNSKYIEDKINLDFFK